MIPAVVLGGSGYVAGELLRLLSGHPGFRLAAVLSKSHAGTPVTDRFLHLRGTTVEELTFSDDDTLQAIARSCPGLAVFSALPHGDAATRIEAVLSGAAAAGCEARVVDLSADFRHRDPARYAAIYGKPHGAPALLPDFVCALPEHVAGPPSSRHVAHPGCFTTAAMLALAPLLAGDLIEPRATVVAVTGSTGAGGTPTQTTHHPERRSDLFAYAAGGHRHEPEMRALAATAAGTAEPAIHFVPQSGPFARGIHATVSARLKHPLTSEEVRASASAFYASPASFVRVLPTPPRLQSVVGTNRCDLSFATRDDEVLAFAALDNLVKGAAGGGVQWMNRLFGLPEAAGLALPGLGWL